MSKQNPPRLGRGLSSLISPELRAGPQQTTAEPTEAQVQPTPATPTYTPASQVRAMVLPLTAIRANPSQPRKLFEEDLLRGLAESIKQSGIIQPILVRPSGNGYELVAGERRLRAATLAGLTEIPAIVRPVADNDMLELALVENIQRQDLNPIDRARAYQALMTRHGLTHDQIAAKTGEDRATISNFLRLLGLHNEVQVMLITGELSTGHAKALSGITDKQLQYTIAQSAVTGAWSVRQVEAAIAKTKQGSPAPAQPEARSVVKDVEDALSKTLGLRVRIHEGRRKHTGKLIIEYYNLDDFERVTARLGLSPEPA